MNRRQLLVRIDEGRVEAVATRGCELLWHEVAAWAADLPLATALAAVATGAPAVAEVTVAFARPPLQLRVLTDMPRIGRTALRRAIAMQPQRFFRTRPGEPLLTDAAWRRERRGARVAVVAAVPDSLVAAVDQAAADLDWPRVTVTAEGQNTPRLRFVTGTARATRRAAVRREARRWALAAAAIWLAAAALVVGRFVQRERRVAATLASIAAPARSAAAARAELERLTAMERTVAATHQGALRMLTHVGDIALALPDSAFLVSFDIDSSASGSLTGAAPRAAGVITALDRSAAAVNPRLVGPAVREAMPGRSVERFVIAFGRERAR